MLIMSPTGNGWKRGKPANGPVIRMAGDGPGGVPGIASSRVVNDYIFIEGVKKVLTFCKG
jgi:hypothetical protein